MHTPNREGYHRIKKHDLISSRRQRRTVAELISDQVCEGNPSKVREQGLVCLVELSVRRFKEISEV